MAEQSSSSQKSNLFLAGMNSDLDPSFIQEGQWSLKCCTRCLTYKSLSSFYKNRATKNGYKTICKVCDTEGYLTRKKEVPLELTCNKCKEIKPSCDFTKDKRKIYGYRLICKPCRNTVNKDYWRDNPGFKKTHNKWKRNYRKTAAGKLSYRKHYQKARQNIHFWRARHLLWHVIKKKNIKKVGHSEKLLGYTVTEFRNRFPIIPKKYHFDHIIPVNWFKNNAPISIINSLDNLQLLPAKVNLSKGDFYADKITEEFMNIVREWIKEEYLNLIPIYGRTG